jgi:hypothetical protein
LVFFFWFFFSQAHQHFHKFWEIPKKVVVNKKKKTLARKKKENIYQQKAVRMKRKNKDSDITKTRKSCRITPKDHVRNPSGENLNILNEVIRTDQNKSVLNHPKKRVDDITGISYKIVNQPKFQNICGTRNSGLFTLDFIPKNTVAFVSRRKGIPLPKLMRSQLVMKGYHFLGRHFFPISCHTMKANIVSMLDETKREKANARLVKYSKTQLEKKNVHACEAGMHACILSTDDIPANSFVLLDGYHNTKDYPYGSEEFLQLEQKVISIYKKAMSEKKKQGPRTQVCKKCCELYVNTKKGQQNIHIKKCEGNLLKRLWESR